MSNLGRNFTFRQSPIPQHRLGRFVNGSTQIPNGVPVTASGTPDANGRLTVGLATEGSAPKPGLSGIAVYEVNPGDAYNGYDPVITTPSDLDFVPANRPVQVVHGTEVRVAPINTSDSTYMGLRDYDGRVIVAGLGATPTLAVGDYLTPGAGSDSAGYWKETSDASLAWMVVTNVDSTNNVVEAQLLF